MEPIHIHEYRLPPDGEFIAWPEVGSEYDLKYCRPIKCYGTFTNDEQAHKVLQDLLAVPYVEDADDTELVDEREPCTV